MGIIQSYGLEVITSIEPFDGFWVKTTQSVDIEFCGTTGGGAVSPEEIVIPANAQLISYNDIATGDTLYAIDADADDDSVGIIKVIAVAFNTNNAIETLEDIPVVDIDSLDNISLNSTCSITTDDNGTYQIQCPEYEDKSLLKILSIKKLTLAEGESLSVENLFTFDGYKEILENLGNVTFENGGTIYYITFSEDGDNWTMAFLDKTAMNGALSQLKAMQEEINNKLAKEDEDFKNLLLANLPNFLKNANGQTVTIFEDEAVTCKFVYDGNSSSTVDCSNPDYNGDSTIDWKNLEFVYSDGNDKIAWVDNNTLCVNYEEDGIYRTGCAVINIPQPTDGEILAGLTNGSRVGFWYNPEIADWEPTGICSTYYDNGTVAYKDVKNNVVGVCNYTVDNSTLITTCETGNGTITRVGKVISPFTLPEKDMYGKIVNGKIYVNGELVKWNNFISIQVESCEQFWKEHTIENAMWNNFISIQATL